MQPKLLHCRCNRCQHLPAPGAELSTRCGRRTTIRHLHSSCGTASRRNEVRIGGLPRHDLIGRAGTWRSVIIIGHHESETTIKAWAVQQGYVYLGWAGNRSGTNTCNGVRCLLQYKIQALQDVRRRIEFSKKDGRRAGGDKAYLADMKNEDRRARSPVVDAGKESGASIPGARQDSREEAHPRGVVDIGWKSVRPLSTKWWRTRAQSSRVSQVILEGGSTSTGMTWLTLPHWMMMTAVPMPPFCRHRCSRRWMSVITSGSQMYVLGTT